MDPSNSNESPNVPVPNLLTAPPLPLAPLGSSPSPPPPAHIPYSDPQPTAPLPKMGNEPPKRLLCLDAYRGLIMIALAFGGFGLAKAANNIIGLADKAGDGAMVSRWEAIRHQFSHAEWVGCSFWDMIQPSFMFMVGVSMAYSYASRSARGHSYMRMMGHAGMRAVILVLLGVFLVSWRRGFEAWTFTNVLSQIGLGYIFLFLMWNRGRWTQWGVVAVVLGGTWCAMTFYSGAGIEKGAEPNGVSAEWVQQNLVDVPVLYPANASKVNDVGAGWHKNANFFSSVDAQLLNALPHKSETIKPNAGGYATLNFIPAFVTMLFGLMAGQLMRSDRGEFGKFGILVFAGIVALAAGYVLDYSGQAPLVKRIWTPTFAIFSTGWCLLILAGLYFVFDLCRLRFLAWPLKIAGMNSMALYVMLMTLTGWTGQILTNLLGKDFYAESLVFLNGIVKIADPKTLEAYATAAAPMAQATSVGLVFWLMTLWMYRQKLFVRI